MAGDYGTSLLVPFPSHISPHIGRLATYPPFRIRRTSLTNHQAQGFTTSNRLVRSPYAQPTHLSNFCTLTTGSTDVRARITWLHRAVDSCSARVRRSGRRRTTVGSLLARSWDAAWGREDRELCRSWCWTGRTGKTGLVRKVSPSSTFFRIYGFEHGPCHIYGPRPLFQTIAPNISRPTHVRPFLQSHS